MDLAKAHLRVARPTDDLAAVVQFYRDGLGFEVLYEFKDHDGFDGVMLGRKGAAYHLEFTRKAGHKAGRAPTEDNLLVFYLPDEAEWNGGGRPAGGGRAHSRSRRSTRTGTGRAGRSRTPTATGWSSRTRRGSPSRRPLRRPALTVVILASGGPRAITLLPRRTRSPARRCPRSSPPASTSWPAS